MLAILMILGLLPFALGGFLNWFMMANSGLLPNLVTIGFAALVIWGAIAFAVKPYVKSIKKTVIGLNLPAFAVLILVGVQELILHAYWQNAVGAWTQLFYLPLIDLGFRLTPWSHGVFSAYCAAFVLMVEASAIGCVLRKK